MTQPQNHHSHNLGANTQLDQMLSGGGEMGALIRTLNWADTPLGPIEEWPQSLRTAVSICLFSRFPIHIWWGPEFIELYNDAYRPILGSTKHPASLGQPGAVTSAEIWHIIGPMLRNVYENAVSTWSDNLMLPMDRYGYTEETYFTLSYSPIFVETGGVGGIFTVVTETTQQVIGERRLRTLHRLSERSGEAKTAEEACRLAEETLADNREDIPFALIYLLNQSGTQASLVASSGIESLSDLNPALIDLTTNATSLWPAAEVMATGKTAQITNLANQFNTLPPSPWAERPDTALVLPIPTSGGAKLAGFLIGGVSARLALDADYLHFYELIAGHITTAVANVRAYEAERERAEALAELDHAKMEFFSNISHEFRTPLTLMLNPLQEVLTTGEKLSTDQRLNLEMAYRNSLRLQKLVNTLLDFSRIQSNRIRASFEPTDLSVFTADLASSFRSVVERTGLRLIIDCPPLPEPVYVDREMWEKIVLNLLSNAFKFTFDGEITVSLRAAHHAVELQVRDTGIGIAEDDLPHIFERFHRVRGARARTYEGSGIGLALVAELVHFHSGQLEAVSAPGKGTTFTISIPLGTSHLPQDQISSPRLLSSTAVDASSFTEEAMRWLAEEERNRYPNTLEPTRAKVDTAELRPVASRSSSKILVADDNADMRDYLRRLLETRYQVETVNDGLAALSRVEQNMPDLVLADVMMPNLDGFGLLNALRTGDRTRALPVMLLSARAGEEARIEGLQAGANDYLNKPFSARELMARVEAQLQLAQLRRETQTTIENIIEGIADPFYALDRDWCFVYANHRAQEMWGKTLGQLVGRNIWELFPQGVNTEAYQEMVDAVAQQRSTAFETFSGFLNHWVEINLYPSSSGLAVYFRDIDARKQLEIALLKSERRLRAMFNQAAIGIATIASDGKILEANPGFCNMLGYSPEEIVTLKASDITHPDDHDVDAELFNQVLNGDLPAYTIEKRCIRKDREIIWIKLTRSLIHIPSSDPNQTLVIVEDITQRKQAEEAAQSVQSQLNHQQQRIVNIFESISDAFTALDKEFRYTYLNSQGAELNYKVSGKTVDELIGKTVWEAFPGSYDSVFGEAYRRAMRDGQPIQFQAFFDLLDCWFEVRVYPSKDGLAIYFADITEQQKTQIALREVEERLQLAQQAGKVGVWDWDAATRTTYWADVMWRLYGLDPQPSLQDGIWNTLLHPADRQRVETKIDVTLASTDMEYRDEFRIVRPDGSLRWIESIAQVTRDEQQNPVRMFGVNLDITERKRIEEALRQAEDRLRTMIDSAKDYAIFSLDAVGRVTTWNTGAERVFGYSEAEIVGMEGSIIYTHEDQKQGIPEQENRKAVEVGYAENERWHVRKGGSRIFVSGMVRPMWDEAGALRGFTKVARDVTERKLAEERTDLLQHLAAELSAQLTPQEMAASIVKAVYKGVGEALISIFLLLPNEQVIERLYTEGLTHEYQSQFSRVPLTARFPAAEAARTGEIVWTGPQDDYLRNYAALREQITALNIHSTIALPLKLNEQILGSIAVSFHFPRQLSTQERELLIAIAHLCTQALQRAQLFETEQQARREAEEANALKMKFLGMISHELRTPLASIKGFTSTLLATDIMIEPEQQRRFLGIVDEETDKLTGLVEQLLDLSRLQSGTLRIELTPQSFAAILKSSVTQLQTLTAQHHLRIEMANNLPHVLADSQRIAQVLVNLVGNAAKFSPAGTDIVIAVSLVDQDVQVDVSDQGIGIPREEREKIFEAFRQIDRKNPGHRPGAGLGLAICKSIVEAHHGRIWVQDRAVGTTISFTMRIARPFL
jgi:PAS domain S-box-containing protein